MENSTQTGQITKSSVWIVARFKMANTGRVVLLKICLIFLIGAIVVVPAFLLRDFVLKANPPFTNNTAFIHFTDPIFNPGVAWSGLSDAAPALIIFLQLLPVIIGILVIVWLRKWWTIIPVLLFVIGGICNFADRLVDDTFTNGLVTTVYTNTVVDYLQFTGRTEKFNLPDAFIIIGAGLAVIAIVLSTLLGIFKKTPVPVVKKV